MIDLSDLLAIIAKMSADNRLGRLGALVSAIAIGSAGIGGGAAAASEGRFQAIIQPGSMPSLNNSTVIIDQQEAMQDVPVNQEVDKRKYQIALDVMGQFIDINSNPITKEIYQRAMQSPEEFIEIVDPLGTREYYVPHKYSYFVYSQPIDKEVPSDFRDWSFKIDVDDSENELIRTKIEIQLNHSGHVYIGAGDFVVNPGELSITAKALQADYLFNIPPGMQLEYWVVDKDPESPFLWMRQYPDGNGGVFTQRIGAGNAILLEANFPKH